MCIFCEIIDNNIPSKKIYEDDNFLAILDIAQTTKGHCLVMPKKHYENFLKMPKEEFKELMALTQMLSVMITRNLKAAGCNILINTNEIAGQTINHVHCHIIPRYNENDTIKIEFKENQFDLDTILKEIKG